METKVFLQQLVEQGLLSYDGHRYRLTEPVASHYANNQLDQKFLLSTLKYFENLKNSDSARFSGESKTLESLKNKAKNLGIIDSIDCRRDLENLISSGIVEFDGQRYRLSQNILPLVNASSLPTTFLPKVLAYFEQLKENNPPDFSREEKTWEAWQYKTKQTKAEKPQTITEQLQQLVGLGILEVVDNRYKLKQELRKITTRNPVFSSALAATLAYFISQIPKQPKSFLAQESKTIKILIYEGKKAGLNNLVKHLQKVIDNKNVTLPTPRKLPSAKSNKSVDNPLSLFKTLGSGLVGVLIGYFLLPDRQPCKLSNEPVIPPKPISKTLPPTENLPIPLPQPEKPAIVPKTPRPMKLSIQFKNGQEPTPKPQQKSAPKVNIPAPVAKAKPSPTPASTQTFSKKAEKKPTLTPTLKQEPPQEINADTLHLY